VTWLTLNLITASRLLVCPAVWLWCWWKRPKWMVLWMLLVAAWFLLTDHFDGHWARRYGLVSEVGYWIDHVGDFIFYGAVVLTLVMGSREPPLTRRRGRERGDAPTDPSGPTP
jgi:phosphatidylglycerophosphate synthase